MKRIVLMVTVALVMAAMMAISAMPAFAVASPQASCNGIGGSTEAGFWAKQHLGSVDACFG